MISIEKTEIKACCGKTQINLKVNFSLSKDHLSAFTDIGFIAAKGFLDAGIMYIEDNALIVICPFGQNTMQLKCKSNSQCQDSISKIEKAIFGLDVK